MALTDEEKAAVQLRWPQIFIAEEAHNEVAASDPTTPVFTELAPDIQHRLHDIAASICNYGGGGETPFEQAVARIRDRPPEPPPPEADPEPDPEPDPDADPEVSAASSDHPDHHDRFSKAGKKKGG